MPCLATLSQVVGVTDTYHPFRVPFQQNCVGSNVLRGTPLLDPEMNRVWSYSNMTTLPHLPMFDLQVVMWSICIQ